MKKKNNTGILFASILLVILFVTVITLVFYKGFIYEEPAETLENNGATTMPTTNSTTTKKQDVLSENKIKEYLSYVPFSLLHDDAYEGNRVTINSVNRAALLYTVYHNGDFDYILSENEEACLGEDCVLEEEFNSALKNMYNIDITFFDSEEDTSEKWYDYEEYLKNKNGYYFELGYGGGKEKSEKIELDYEIQGNELIIKEQVAIIHTSEETVTIYNGKEKIKEYSIIDENGSIINVDDDISEYIETNFDKFSTYKHTFKRNTSGTYYWYSTEVVENKEN